MGKDAQMIGVVCRIFAIGLAVALCDGCRRIQAPHPPKEPAVTNLAAIDNPEPSTRPAATRPAVVIEYQTYVVVRGDTLGRIAQKVYNNAHNDSVILDANPGLDPRKLVVGQVLKYPVKKKKTPASLPAERSPSGRG
jgi:nucleoid-associated protein YgaU